MHSLNEEYQLPQDDYDGEDVESSYHLRLSQLSQKQNREGYRYNVYSMSLPKH